MLNWLILSSYYCLSRLLYSLVYFCGLFCLNWLDGLVLLLSNDFDFLSLRLHVKLSTYHRLIADSRIRLVFDLAVHHGTFEDGLFLNVGSAFEILEFLTTRNICLQSIRTDNVLNF